jgi:hypothetical protein
MTTRMASLWSSLQPALSGSAEYVVIRIPEITGSDAYAGRHVVTGHEAVILEVGTGSIPAVAPLPQGQGFEVISHTLSAGRGGRSRLILQMTDPSFRDLFEALAEDVVRTVAGETDATGAARVFIRRIIAWQVFLRAHNTPLGLEQRRGLFGELWFLRDKLAQWVGVSDALSSWKGAEAAVHDFQLPQVSIEVKTTAAASPRAVSISNIRQLEPGAVPLFLLVLQVAEAESGQFSLPELVQLIHEALPPAEKVRFIELLAEGGYMEAHAGEYLRPRYTPIADWYYRVTESFPRVQCASVPAGVEDVRFSVSLSACVPYQIRWDQLISGERA